ncbi:hypothetical protein FH972_026309 [Carpinus fangiana]|uniref:L-lactate dehydrogenase (cytochrome) n=1 Tax=Carpinus fangiana TaxID=176857 RepID=A0A5N6L3K1_9ROSI|nr:hypothetical protein FH972_026309 [Carpinus fangiana]
MGAKRIAVDEISQHASPEDCWIVVDGDVWDMTDFAPNHPGGPSSRSPVQSTAVCRADRDNKSTITEEWARPPPQATPELKLGEKPPLSSIINSYDFEEVASSVLSKKTWAFYSSAATDCITRDANKSMLDRIWFRPRLLRNVEHVSTKTKMLGCDLDLPLFISPAAMAKLVHPDGEKLLAKGAHAKGIAQSISTNASFPVQEIVQECPESHPFFFQLYVNSDRSKTKTLLESVLALRPRIRGIFITIDAPIPGKREADERLKADKSLVAPNSGARATNDKKGSGIGRIMGAYVDKRLSWEDLRWIRSVVGPDMPLVLKGVQHAADARLAASAGMQGIVIGNHGGRSLDTSPPAVLALLELHKCCPEVFERLEVYVDGGIRRGTDILKCLCLGARAVGMGRHFLYSLTYGQEGVEHLIDLMKDELETSMRMIGVTDVSQISPDYVNTGDVDHLVPASLRHPYAVKPKI